MKTERGWGSATRARATMSADLQKIRPMDKNSPTLTGEKRGTFWEKPWLIRPSRGRNAGPKKKFALKRRESGQDCNREVGRVCWGEDQQSPPGKKEELRPEETMRPEKKVGLPNGKRGVNERSSRVIPKTCLVGKFTVGWKIGGNTGKPCKESTTKFIKETEYRKKRKANSRKGH